jgi:hypothetical protein
LDNFNRFDGALCEAPLAAFLLDLFAAARSVFEVFAFADFAECARAGPVEEDLGDFLRVFLDIRLPFVAFGGSTIGI